MPWPVRPLAALLVASALLALAPSAEAARFGRCARGGELDAIGSRCARVAVPLDRSGRVPGTVSLRVARTDLARRPRRTILALAGGPGQAAVPFTLDFAITLIDALEGARLVTFDQRGTGGSGALRCPELERARDAFTAPGAAEACANRLGERRAFYRSQDSAEDVEAVRRAVGAERLVIYGVSYGTKVAVEYARRYPERVERLVLDSALEPEGPDPFYRDSFRASARVLRDLCVGRRCARITADPVADLRTLAGRVGAAPIDDYVYDGRGRRRGQRVDGFALATALIAGDFDPTMRRAFPAAVAGALRGDGAPIARLVRRASAVENDVGPPSLFSVGLYAATVCEEAPLPWARDAPFDDRPRQAAEAAAAVPASELDPFDAAAALGSDFLATCSRWPAASPAPEPIGPLPAVPALVVAGEEDLRTPLEEGARLAGRIAGGRVLPVAGVAHSVLGSSDCAARAVARFVRGRSVPARCRRTEPRPDLDPVAPLSLAEVREAPGARGRRGRTAVAAVMTMVDVGGELLATVLAGADEGAIRGGGLRGGSFAATTDELRMRSVEYVPGVRVSGTVDFQTGLARLRIAGPGGSRGTLRIGERGRIAGRLDGRRVRARVPRDLAAAATSRPRATLGELETRAAIAGEPRP
jgi:pimeloyl-ACP methyl ester carboxylesterase